MEFKHTLPEKFIKKAASFSEFKSGASQIKVKTKDGLIYKKILISNCKWIIAIRGFKELPFSVNEIDDIYQTEEDKNPEERGNWEYWDEWPKS